ncbi:MAG: outer membrane beta-barrel protein [Rickettsiales bacterium]|jgi:opacity protein-like surface antigen|nr:outer membrane beta-barrel protein [Rickettsiales bacterium]
MKRFALLALGTIAATPALSADDRGTLEPYVSMRASYAFMNATGNQTVYIAPGGTIAAKLSHEDLDIDDNRAFGMKLAFGGDMDLPFLLGRLRVEAEYANNGSFITPLVSAGGTATLSTQSSALFGNAYYSLNTGTFISPYVGAGIGLSHFTADGDFSSGSFNGKLAKSEYALGWQASAGLGIYLGGGTAIDLGYRYSDLGKFTGGVDISQMTAPSGGGAVSNSTALHNDVEIKFHAHEILLGVRYLI